MEKFFNIFGKVVILVLILGGVAYLSFNFGQKKQIPGDRLQVRETPAVSQTPSSTVTPTIVPTKIVLGGVDRAAGLSFNQYSLKIPSGWKDSREKQTENMDEKLILEKEGYQISIFQAATGGALCLYPEDADFEGPSSRFTVFKEIATADGITLRRSGSGTVNKNGKIGFTMCQKSSDGSFGQPTNYGHISLTLPKGYLETELLEMDTIISSLTKR